MDAFVNILVVAAPVGLALTVLCGLVIGDGGQWPKFIDWLIAIFVVMLLVSVGSLGTRDAAAHQAPAGWTYPLSCCSSYDCREAETGEVKETPAGFVIAGTGEVVPIADQRIRKSPDGRFHWCSHQSGVEADRTICLFVPPRGF